MNFFLTLSEVGRTKLLPIFQSIIEFFTTPLKDLLGSVGDFNSAIPTNFLDFLNGFLNGRLNPLSLVVDLLTSLGLDLSMPFWEFLVTNIGLILVFLFVVKLLDIIN